MIHYMHNNLLNLNNRCGVHIFNRIVLMLVTFATFMLCVSIGSVNIPIKETLGIIYNSIIGNIVDKDMRYSIVMIVRLPRVINVALVGASLSLCGATTQGLIRNPLADGSTIGVASGASLGAVMAIALGITIPQVPMAGSMVMSIIFAFFSLIIIMTLSLKVDNSLSTNTIILVGVIYSMFVSGILSLIITICSNKIKSITFWLMGSLAGSSYIEACVLGAVLIIAGTVLIGHADELNAFGISEVNAAHIGVNVYRVKIIVLITVSTLIGISVSIGGIIGFVGLIIPHIARMIVGANHRKLLITSIFLGANFLMITDLVSRVIISPLELPLGVVTSLVGTVFFIGILYKRRQHG